MDIRLHFSLGAGLSSRLIAWWGYAYGGYSHTDAVLSDGTLAGARSDSVGGKPPGFQIRPAYYEDWKASALVSIPATDAEHQKWEAWQRAQVGEPYDKIDILGLILGRPVMSAGHWICSAAQTGGLQQVGKLPAALPFIDQQTTPNTLLFACAAIGGRVSKFGASKAGQQPAAL